MLACAARTRASAPAASAKSAKAGDAIHYAIHTLQRTQHPHTTSARDPRPPQPTKPSVYPLRRIIPCQHCTASPTFLTAAGCRPRSARTAPQRRPAPLSCCRLGCAAHGACTAAPPPSPQSYFQHDSQRASWSRPAWEATIRQFGKPTTSCKSCHDQPHEHAITATVAHGAPSDEPHVTRRGKRREEGEGGRGRGSEREGEKMAERDVHNTHSTRRDPSDADHTAAVAS